MFRNSFYKMLNLILSSPVRVLGQTQIGDSIGDRIDDLEKEDFQNTPFAGQDDEEIRQLVSLVQKLAIPAGVTVLMGLFAYGGFMMITSQGDPEKLNEAKEILTNAVMGFIFIALASTILLIINNTLGLGAEQFF